MQEPSVLDYVKAKLKFWEKTDLRIPDRPVSDISAVSEQAVDQENRAAVLQERVETSEAVSFPWMVVLPLVVAMFAQMLLEPPSRYAIPAAVVYTAAAVLTGFSAWRGALVLAPLPAAVEQNDVWKIRWGEALMGLPLALIAFLLFTDNRFTLINVSLWLIAIGLFLVAFLGADRRLALKERISGLWQALRQPGQFWQIRVSRWTLLLVAVLAVIAFFRFYRLDGIPIDMVSDHAEKLLDVNDVLNGTPYIFFERNTGREPFQFYWTVLVIKLFGLDVSFFALKLGTALTGLIAVYFTWRLGNLLGGRWVGLFALLLVGVAYWPNVISRIALRFPLYPMFVAPLLFYLIRGLRGASRADYVWAGLWLGIGLNGYTSSRIVPFLVVLAVGLYLLHRRKLPSSEQATMGLIILALFALLVCLPLFRYFSENPQAVMFRSLTRLTGQEQALPGSPLEIFLSNFWAVITMFFYNNGSIWPHSIPFRPALDVVMAALFFTGMVLLVVRYIRQRNWEDLLLLLAVPVLLLPSALSLAFPGENPSLNRTAGAYVPVLVIAAMALDALLRGIAARLPGSAGRAAAVVVGLLILVWTVSNNYGLFFQQYADNYKVSAWNTREIGEVVRGFAQVTGTYDTYYVVGYPYWIDSRQVAIFAGHIERDPAVLPETLDTTLSEPRMKMFILKPEDQVTLDTLSAMYPRGHAQLHQSDQPGKDFVLFIVPAKSDMLP